MVGIGGVLILSLVSSGAVWGQKQSEFITTQVEKTAQPVQLKTEKPKTAKPVKRVEPAPKVNRQSPHPKPVTKPITKPAPKPDKPKPEPKTTGCQYAYSEAPYCDNSDPCDPTTIKDPELQGRCAN